MFIDSVLLGGLVTTSAYPVFTSFAQFTDGIGWLSPLFAIAAIAFPVFAVLFFVFTAWFFARGNSRQVASILLSPAVVVVSILIGALTGLLLGYQTPCKVDDPGLSPLCTGVNFGAWGVPDLSMLVAALTGITLMIRAGFAAVQLFFSAGVIFSLIWIGEVFPQEAFISWLVVAVISAGITALGNRIFGQRLLAWFERWNAQRRWKVRR